jgi:membrane associated rhomboid family serine protease
MVIPIRDIQERHRFPLVTIGLIAVNVMAFLYEMSLGPGLQNFFLENAFIPARYFESGNHIADQKAVLVSMFLHGGWAHLLGNMLYMWIFADNVEDKFHHIPFLLFYLFCGWVATMSHAMLSPDSPIPTVGASGAISGVLGAYLVMFPKARVITLIPLGFFIHLRELPALFVLGLWFALQLFGAAAAAGAEGGGVAWWAHVGGFVPGVLIGFIYRARVRAPAR